MTKITREMAEDALLYCQVSFLQRTYFNVRNEYPQQTIRTYLTQQAERIAELEKENKTTKLTAAGKFLDWQLKEQTLNERIAELDGIVRDYLVEHRAFRVKPIGAPYSEAREAQDRQIALEDRAKAALAQQKGG